MSLAERRIGQKRVSAPDPAILLAWYDHHRRILPWRAPAGERQDPYRVWLSEIMLQQTTVKAVAPYYARFLARWPTVASIAAAPLDDVLKLWAGLGYYARARNLHACAQVVMQRHGGIFPASEAALRTLPGVGDYTAAAVAAIAFDAPVVPVDGNIERVVARLFAVEDELPAAKPLIRKLAAGLTPSARPGDFAQGLMDLGAGICTPKKPKCAFCAWNGDCAAFERGDPEAFPRKSVRATGRLRRGAAFVVVRADGAVLARTRASSGLLGGMTEVPSTEWSHDFDEARALQFAPQLGLPGACLKPAPAEECWRRIPGAVSHTFTHFPLELVVYRAAVAARTDAPNGMRWVAASEIAGEAFPTVMRKVLMHARVV